MTTRVRWLGSAMMCASLLTMSCDDTSMSNNGAEVQRVKHSTPYWWLPEGERPNRKPDSQPDAPYNHWPTAGPGPGERAA